MKHFICFTVAILVFFSSAFTQNDTVCFDRSRINALSFVSPDYINSNDVSQIKKQVKKHYIRNKVLENLAINDTDFIKSIDTSEIKYLSELILTRYYGEKYNKYIMENVSVDSSEIRDYYTHHISHFTPPAKYSYS